MLSVNPDPEFQTQPRGHVRDVILDYFRAGLLRRINPETGVLFTEDEVARATGPGTRWYRQASAIDDYGQGVQRNALWHNDQIRIDRACTKSLDELHAPLWDPEGRLPATGGYGPVLITGAPGTLVVGSTLLNDPSAYWGRSSKGVRVQVWSGGEIGSSGSIIVTMIATDTGSETDLPADDEIFFAERDPNMAPTATVAEDWTGGTDPESDAARASRMISAIRHKQGGGNDAQQRAIARRVSNAVEDVFIYQCPFGAGSAMFVPTQKRGKTNRSPTARIPGNALIAAITARMVPPGSPDNPAPPRIVICPPVAESTNIDLRVDLQVGSRDGFYDAIPFPLCSNGGRVSILSWTATELHIRAPGSVTLPGSDAGATLSGEGSIPKMMYWDVAYSKWQKISGVQSVTHTSANDYTLTFATSVPAGLRSTSVVISPYVSGFMSDLISQALMVYFDERGPAELFTLVHERSGRCQRFPERREMFPSHIGEDIVTYVLDALSETASRGVLQNVTTYEPDIPSDPISGPSMLVLGTVGVYPL